VAKRERTDAIKSNILLVCAYLIYIAFLILQVDSCGTILQVKLH